MTLTLIGVAVFAIAYFYGWRAGRAQAYAECVAMVAKAASEDTP